MNARQIFLGVFAIGSMGIGAGNAATTLPSPTVNPPSSVSSVPTVEKLFDKWMLKCAAGFCQVFLTLADEKTKEAKFSWTFVYDSKTAKISTIVQLPLMTALPPGVRISINKDSHLTWPFQYCDGTGCRAVAALTDQIFSSFKNQEYVVVQSVLYGEQKATTYKIPMAGLSAAVGELISVVRVPKQ